MPNQPRTASPFESLEKLSKKAAQPIGQVASDVLADVQENLGMTVKQKQQIKQGDKAKISQIQQNIAQIDQQMAEARKKREQKWAEQIKKSEQTKQTKQIEKKREDSVLQKLLKSRAGTKEAMPRASG